MAWRLEASFLNMIFNANQVQLLTDLEAKARMEKLSSLT